MALVVAFHASLGRCNATGCKIFMEIEVYENDFRAGISTAAFGKEVGRRVRSGSMLLLAYVIAG